MATPILSTNYTAQTALTVDGNPIHIPGAVNAVAQAMPRAVDLEQLADAKSVDVRLKPIEHSVYNTTFNVAGAREAIAKVYSDCGDTNPIG